MVSWATARSRAWWAARACPAPPPTHPPTRNPLAPAIARSWNTPSTHLQHALHRVHALAEQVHVQLLEARARDGGVEVDALEQRVNLDRRLRGGSGRAGRRAVGKRQGWARLAGRARQRGCGKHQQTWRLDPGSPATAAAAAAAGAAAAPHQLQRQAHLGGGGQGALGALAGRAQAAHRARVAADVLLVLALELLRRAVGGRRLAGWGWVSSRRG